MAKKNPIVRAKSHFKKCRKCGRCFQFSNERLCSKLMKLHMKKEHNSFCNGVDVVRLEETFYTGGRKEVKNKHIFGE